MSFNTSKCVHLKITNKHFPMQTSYYLGEYIIQQSQSATYLGVKIDQRLKWSEHISSIISKANAANAFLKHNLSGCSSKVKKNGYLSMVRPILEYASIVWSPHTQCDIHKTEMVQCRAVRSIFNNFSRTASITNMLANLQLPTLKCRRKMLKLIMLYCILYHFVKMKSPGLTHFTTRTHGHSLHLTQPFARTDTYFYSFYPSSIRLWNNLPCDIV